MAEALPPRNPERTILLLLAPLAAVSLPSLVFCILELTLWAHGALTTGQVVFHIPARTLWDELLSVQTSVYAWVARWNSAATLAATGVLAFTLLRPQWRHWVGLALIPYGVLLCADFTMHLQSILLP